MYKPLEIYAPQTRNAKNPLLNALKYKVNKAKTVSFLPVARLAQSILKRKFPTVDKPLQK